MLGQGSTTEPYPTPNPTFWVLGFQIGDTQPVVVAVIVFKLIDYITQVHMKSKNPRKSHI